MERFLQISFFVAVVQCLDELSFQNVTTAPQTRENVALPSDWKDHSSVNISIAQPKPKKRVKTLDSRVQKKMVKISASEQARAEHLQVFGELARTGNFNFLKFRGSLI